MAVDGAIAAGGLQFFVKGFEQGVFHFDLAAAYAADDVVMFFSRDLIHKMPIHQLRGMHQSILRQKLQRAVDGGLGQPGQVLFCQAIDIGRRKMRPLVAQDVQDRQSLRGHSVTTGAELGGVVRSAGHELSYCKFLQ